MSKFSEQEEKTYNIFLIAIISYEGSYCYDFQDHKVKIINKLLQITHTMSQMILSRDDLTMHRKTCVYKKGDEGRKFKHND